MRSGAFSRHDFPVFRRISVPKQGGSFEFLTVNGPLTGTETNFFARKGPFPLSQLVKLTGAEGEKDKNLSIAGVAPIDRAGPDHLTFLDNRKYIPQLTSTHAGACLVLPELAGKVPAGTVCLKHPHPYRAFARVTALFYPDALRPGDWFGEGGMSTQALVHPGATIEEGVRLEPGCCIGDGAQIGAGSIIGAGAVIGVSVKIGRGCVIGPGATISHAMIGDSVILHPGVRIGQDGFGFSLGKKGHLKVPQIGRVIIQDDVEIGANSTIDRGSLKDTVIGEGTKIDNLVQIAHNVVIGRHCIIIAQVGISGSTVLGDFVVMGGQSGASGHLTIGDGARIAGKSAVKDNVPAGESWFGTPAMNIKAYMRDRLAFKKLVRGDKKES